MEKLYIRNFLIFREVEFPVNQFVVIIGPQASGKSLLLKLLYFFRKFLKDVYVASIKDGETKHQVIEKGEMLFSDFFRWENSRPFEIIYTNNDAEVWIKGKESSRGQLRLELNYSDKLTVLHRRYRREYRRHLMQDTSENPWDDFAPKSLLFRKYVSHWSVFIPSGRSFFSFLDADAFTLWPDELELEYVTPDPFIKEFASLYRASRRLYELARPANKISGNFEETLEQFAQAILKGQYGLTWVDDFEEGWLDLDKVGKISPYYASSGQQEALPLLVVLRTLPFSIKRDGWMSLFIEEPEAHLFPRAQHHMVNLFSWLYRHQQQTIITTHSPYILTALNNLILAGDIVTDHSGTYKIVKDTIGMGYPIQYEDVGAYLVEEGSLHSIKDDETRLIGADLIDDVSSEFERIFNALLSIEGNSDEKHG